MQISNTPIPCHNCRSMAYGKENSYKSGDKMIVECVWICSSCGQVTRRHSEEIPLNVKREQE